MTKRGNPLHANVEGFLVHVQIPRDKPSPSCYGPSGTMYVVPDRCQDWWTCSCLSRPDSQVVDVDSENLRCPVAGYIRMLTPTVKTCARSDAKGRAVVLRAHVKLTTDSDEAVWTVMMVCSDFHLGFQVASQRCAMATAKATEERVFQALLVQPVNCLDPTASTVGRSPFRFLPCFGRSGTSSLHCIGKISTLNGLKSDRRMRHVRRGAPSASLQVPRKTFDLLGR